MTILERICARYANSFRDGFLRVGGRDYPTWNQMDGATKAETMRCMRHAMEKSGEGTDPELFDALFPDQPRKRSTKPTEQDEVMSRRLRGEL